MKKCVIIANEVFRMKKYNVGDIVSGEVTGIEKYGVFVSIDNGGSGLIHISEVSDNFVSNLNDYVNMGEKIKVKIIDEGTDENHLKLSIKKIDYRSNANKHKKIEETEHGFETLKSKLPVWMKEKLVEIEKSA